MDNLTTCTPKALPPDLWVPAARMAVKVNPANYPASAQAAMALAGMAPQPEHIAVLVGKRWHTAGVRLTVGFLDNPPADLRARILQHMKPGRSRPTYSLSKQIPIPRCELPAPIRRRRLPAIGRTSARISSVCRSDQPTMNLQGFTMSTPESEYCRVVRHETGHTLGFPHEHMRQELVNDIDPQKAIAFYSATQGWSPEYVNQQVLTPIEAVSLLGTAHADPNSVMCYQIPGTITKDGKPIIGGVDIDEQDYAFAAAVYPKALVG